MLILLLSLTSYSLILVSQDNNRGVAQSGIALAWGRGVVGSNPVTPTILDQQPSTSINKLVIKI